MSKEALFGVDDGDEIPDLYDILEVARDVTEEDLRKAYRRRALRTHPDKSTHLDPASAEAQQKTIEFQQIGFAYSVLKDSKRRKLYDTTGSVSEDVIEEGKDWNAYFRELWSGVVDATTIEKFAKTYRNSSEEQSDIIAAYQKHKGDLDQIFTEVMLADEVEDEKRFVEILETAIKNKDIKRTKIYTKSKKNSTQRQARVRAEAAEADELRKELGLDVKLQKKSKKRKHSNEDSDSDDGSIKALIRQRANNRMGVIIANIEEKYSSSSSKKGRKKRSKNTKEAVEPSEEEFQALQAKLFGKN